MSPRIKKSRRRTDHWSTRLYIGLASVVFICALSVLSASSFFAGATGSELGAFLPGIQIDTGNIKLGQNWGVGISGNQEDGFGLDVNYGKDTGGAQPDCGQADNCLIIPGAAEYKGIAHTVSIRDGILKWTNFFLGFFALIAMIAILYAGFQYVTAQGEQEQADKAKKGIIFTTIGIIVVLLAYAFVNTLITYGPKGGDLVQGNLLYLIEQ